MSPDKDTQAEDLELTGEEADRVKGGMLPIEGGDTLSSGTSYAGKKKKKKKKQSKIGPYQGKH
jgi:hypothetical protein